MPVDLSKLGVFEQIHNPDGNGIVQFKDEGKTLFASGGNYAWWRVGSRFISLIGRGIKRLFTGTTENDRARTQLLHNVAEAVGLGNLKEKNQNVAVDANGEIVLNDALLGALGDLLTPEVFRPEDFQLEDGQVVSGCPLTERRVTKICQKVKELEKEASNGSNGVAKPQAEIKIKSLDSVIKFQEKPLLSLVSSLAGSKSLEQIIRMVLLDSNTLSELECANYYLDYGSSIRSDLDDDVRAIAKAIRSSDPRSACQKAIEAYNRHMSRLGKDDLKITKGRLKFCIEAQHPHLVGGEKDKADYSDTAYGFLRLLKYAKWHHNDAKLGNLSDGIANPVEHVVGLSILWSKWNAWRQKDMFANVPVNSEFPETMGIVRALMVPTNNRGRFYVERAVRKVASRRFDILGIRSPLSEADIKSLTEEMCKELERFFQNDDGNGKSESECIDWLFSTLGPAGENAHPFKLSDGRQFSLTREDFKELFYTLFDVMAEKDQTIRFNRNHGLNQKITRTLSIKANGATHDVTSTIAPTIQPVIQENGGRVTNLATSELKGEGNKSLVKFVRFGQSRLHGRDGNPPEGARKNYYTRIVEEMLRANPSAAVRKGEGVEASYTVPLYQIDMCGVDFAVLKGLDKFECQVKKSLVDQNAGPDEMQTIAIDVHRFSVPVDSREGMPHEDVKKLSNELAALLEKAAAKRGDPKIDALHVSLSAYKKAVLDPLVKEEQPLSLAGRGGELMQFGSQVAMLACLLGHTPAIHCNMGKDRTGLMDARIKQLATTLEYANPDAPITVPVPSKEKKPTEAEKKMNTEFVLKTGNNEAAKCIDIELRSTGINVDQSNGHTKLHEEYVAVPGTYTGKFLDGVYAQDKEIVLQGRVG